MQTSLGEEGRWEEYETSDGGLLTYTHRTPAFEEPDLKTYMYLY